jgi:hypothetical protein
LAYKFNEKLDIMASLRATQLIAPCGMNCGICPAYLREKNKCTGCRGSDDNKSISLLRCKIRTCEVFKDSKVKFCFGCENIPCDRLKHLEKRYRTKYSMSMVENLKNIENLGVRKFLESEKARWSCIKCGGTVCVHDKKCSSCGGEL